MQRVYGQKKKPQLSLGREAFLLSHIEAPAQGGKAGSGEPLIAKFIKTPARVQVGFYGIFEY
jgi:hypothetical protein